MRPQPRPPARAIGEDGGLGAPACSRPWGVSPHRPVTGAEAWAVPARTMGHMLARSSYAAGHFLFRLDGDEDAAYLRSVSGGMVKGSVLGEAVGPEYSAFKHLGAVEVDPIAFEIGMSMSRPLLEWIRGSWRREFSRRDGCIIHADANFEPKLEHEFHQALITETKFPALDGAAKEPAYLGVTLHPEWVSMKRAGGGKMRGSVGLNQKKWLPSSFRVDIDGIDCSRVNKVDSFAVRQKIRPLYTGASRLPELEPISIEFSNVTIYMAADFAEPFLRWHEEFVVKGDRDTSSERTGAIEFLTPDRREVLFTVELKQVGLYNLTIDRSEANAEQIKRAKIELYVESMDLKYGSGMG
jgi:hypothetical protein